LHETDNLASASWTTFGTFRINNSWSWRVPSALQGLPSLLQVILVLFGPESPRWLVSKGRDAEALQTLAYYHADGNDQDPLVQYEYDEIKSAIEFDRTVAANVGYKSLFATPGNRKRMRIIVAIAFFSQWSGNGLVSYYLNKVFDSIGITSTTTQLLIQGILAIWNLACAVTASFLVDRLGRRLMFITSAAGMLVFFTLQTVCSAEFALHGNQNAAHAVIAFIFLYYALYDLAFTPLIVMYTVEILPFALRAKGFNIFNFVISVALIFNQYINPIALKHIAWKYYVRIYLSLSSPVKLTIFCRLCTACGSCSSLCSYTCSSSRRRVARSRRPRYCSTARMPRTSLLLLVLTKYAKTRARPRHRPRNLRFKTMLTTTCITIYHNAPSMH
jgi:hypothetical protein